MPWGVCVGPRKINFDDMGLSLGRIHRDSLDKKCLILVLKALPRLKGWRKCCQSVREEIHVGHDVCVLAVPGTPQEAGEANRDWQ